MAKKSGKKTSKKKEGEKKSGSFVNVDSSISNIKDDYEVFKVEKDGKEKGIIQKIKPEEGKPASKLQIKKENRIMRKIIAVMAGCFLLFGALYLIMYFSKNIEYGGVRFELDTNTLKGKTLYRTSIPIIYNETKAMYNFYLRNDPRKLETSVPVYGSINFRKNLVLDLTTENLFCDGDWNLALGNLLKLNLFGISVLAKNESAVYKPEEDFMFVTINEGDRTEIKQLDEVNYEMNVDNCEILPAAERLLVEAFIKYNSLNN